MRKGQPPNPQSKPLTKKDSNMISKYDLTDAQLDQIDANDTLPQGQFFVLEDNGNIIAIDNNLESLWLAQGGNESQIINFNPED
jgi:hypothetical protein